MFFLSLLPPPCYCVFCCVQGYHCALGNAIKKEGGGGLYMMCSALRASVAGVFPWDGWSSGDNRTDDHLKDLLEILFFCA
ncbi:TPA: hypothetical protein MFM65_005678 [Klebsiella pneumoniae]|nr:hypothetical protein [Klebsiella pneumoniae]HBW8410362.1 hypothetical protein [Klebsiella pneumoniae]HBW8526697.1 hypothetical protein [Klebsiella pneumoniae]